MIIGGIAGFAFGKLGKVIINRIKLDFEGLYPALVIAIMFITFSATDFVGGNGFLAIYICAVYLGNQDLIHKRTILKMYDGLAWLAQIVLFLTLGLLVFPSQVLPVFGIGLVISLFLIIVARPVSVFQNEAAPAFLYFVGGFARRCSYRICYLSTIGRN
jgi:cell volume regulation protein A